VRAEVTVTHDLGGARQRRAGGRLVQAAHQACGGDELRVAQRRPTEDDRTRQVGQHFPSPAVDAEKSRRACEADRFEMAKQRVDEGAVGPERPADGVADADHAGGLLPAAQRHLVERSGRLVERSHLAQARLRS
jgi:hypothetical protein